RRSAGVGESLRPALRARRRPVDLHLLAEPALGLEPLLREFVSGLRAARLDGLQQGLGEVEELAGLRDGLRLAADRDEHAEVPGDGREHFALGGRAPSLLAGGRDALLSQEALRGIDIAAGLLKGALGVHHPRAGEVAELFDLARRDLDLAHSAASVTGWGSGAGTLATSSAAGSSSGCCPSVTCSDCCSSEGCSGCCGKSA